MTMGSKVGGRNQEAQRGKTKQPRQESPGLPRVSSCLSQGHEPEQVGVRLPPRASNSPCGSGAFSSGGFPFSVPIQTGGLLPFNLPNRRASSQRSPLCHNSENRFS